MRVPRARRRDQERRNHGGDIIVRLLFESHSFGVIYETAFCMCNLYCMLIWFCRLQKQVLTFLLVKFPIHSCQDCFSRAKPSQNNNDL